MGLKPQVLVLERNLDMISIKVAGWRRKLTKIYASQLMPCWAGLGLVRETDLLLLLQISR